MTKGDKYQKEILQRILDEGCLDKNPRPVYADGTPAHTLSVNHGMCTYDLTKNESPLVTLRPIAVKTSIAEILWIYQKESNDLVVFDELLGKNTWEENHEINNWWKDWALKDENGDLYIEYVVDEHKYFKRDNDDIYLEVPLTITEAILGCKKEIPTLYGNVKLNVPSGTNSGDKQKIRGKGVNN